MIFSLKTIDVTWQKICIERGFTHIVMEKLRPIYKMYNDNNLL